MVNQPKEEAVVMAESLKILKKRASLNKITVGIFNHDGKASPRPDAVTFVSLDEKDSANQDTLDGIRKKISAPKIAVSASGPLYRPSFPRLSRDTSQPVKPKLSRSPTSSQKTTQLLDKHLKERRQSLSPRPSLAGDACVANQDLLQKYLGSSKDKDFLKIPESILNPTMSPSLRKSTSKFKVFANSRTKRTEIPELDEEDERVFSGGLDGLPPESSNIARVFISSTFSDFKEERNAILKTAYPLLKNFCSWLGLEFHLVDLRWGITDEATNDHLTERLCLKEIDNCNRLSCGPSFVCFVGDRYGYRPIPYEIDADQFHSLCRVGDELQLDDVGLFRKWYLRDDNARPPVYVVQAISRFFPYFDNRCEEARANRLEDQRRWNLELEKLQKLFRLTCKAAQVRGILSEKSVKNFTMSVTEMEITRALESGREDIVCFQRRLTGLEDDIDNPVAGQFTDIIPNDNNANIADQDARELREELCVKKIKAILRPENVIPFQVRWFKDGINGPSRAEHSKYINAMCTAFLKRVQTLIQERHDALVKANARLSEKIKELKEEILHHSYFCNARCKIFHGRDVEISLVKACVESKKSSPVIVSALSGSGKTALLAKITQACSDWLGGNCVRIVRFLGTSPESSTLQATLSSICRQICLVYDIPLNEVSLLDIQTLFRYFQDLLNTVSRTHARHRPLFIALDSIDQLTPADGAHRLRWIPSEPPPGVHIVISFIPGLYGLLNCAKELFPDDSCYIKLLPLTVNSCLTIVDMYMETKQRTLTAEQVNLLRSYFVQNPPSPLQLKMIVDDACNWKSHTEITHIEIPLHVEEAIEKLFLKIERTYGAKLVAFTFGYLTVSQNGLTELELKDTLSCNDEVVNEIFQYHDPPVPGMVRVPHLFWTRIKHEIGDYIVERQTDGKTTFYWYHRQFIQAAGKRYVTDNVVQRLHADLAEIFLSENGVFRTICLQKRNLLVKNANRQVTPQPLTQRNLRKLRALSYHLLHSGQIDSLKENALCNFFYLVCRIKAFSVSEVSLVYSRALSVVKDLEIQSVAECIRQAHVLIQEDVLQLGIQFLGRLQDLGEHKPMIAQLCHQALVWFRDKQRPVLAPVCTCFPVDTGSAATWQLGGPTHLIGFHEKGRFVLGFCPSDHSHGAQLQVIDLQEKRLAFTITQFDGYLKDAKFLELSRYKIKVLILTDKTLRVTVFSVGGIVLESRYLPMDFAGTEQQVVLNVLGFYEQFRFGRYCLRFVLGSESKFYDIPERQYLNEEAEKKQPELILTTNYIDISTKNNISVIKVLPSGYIVTCHGKGDNSLKGDKSRGVLILWEDGRRAFQIVLPSPVSSNSMVVTCHHDDSTVLVGCQDNEVVIVSRIYSKWKAQLLKPDFTEGTTAALAYTGSCKLAIAISDKQRAAVYSTEHEAGLFTTQLENVKPIRCASITHNGSHVVTGHNDGGVLVWRLDKQKGSMSAIKNINSHMEAITHIFLQGQALAYVLSEDRTLKCFNQSDFFNPDQNISVRDSSRGNAGYTLTEELAINCFLLSEKKLEVLTSCDQSSPKVWRMTNGKYIRSLSARVSEEGTLKIAFGQQDKLIVGLTTNSFLKVWSYETGETVRTPLISNVLHFCIMSDSTTVVVLQFTDMCFRVTLYDLERHTVLKSSRVAQGRRVYADRILLTEDDRFLILAVRTKGMENMSSRILQAIDLKNPGGALISCTKGQKGNTSSSKGKLDIPTYCTEVLQGSKVLVGKNGEAFCWDLGQRKPLQNAMSMDTKVQSLYHSYVIHSHLKDHGTQTNPVVTVTRSEDGKLVATADNEGFVIVWKLQMAKEISRDVGNFEILHKHSDAVTAMAFSKYGDMLVTGSVDQTLRVWDTSTGKLKHKVTVGMELSSLTIASEKGYLVAMAKGKRQSRLMIFKMLYMDN